VSGGIQLAAELDLEPVVLAGDIPTVRNPLQMSETPPRYDLAPPKLDEHGGEIRRWLGVGERHRLQTHDAGEPPVPSA
jgi:crotonobetainyl-CoA:carnitine CoA-transferase CaiB-like acyl-CoA transferase